MFNLIVFIVIIYSVYAYGKSKCKGDIDES